VQQEASYMKKQNVTSWVSYTLYIEVLKHFMAAMWCKRPEKRRNN
jgi:hypothetical protein